MECANSFRSILKNSGEQSSKNCDRALFSDEWSDIQGKWVCRRERRGLSVQKLADTPCLPLARNKLLIVTEGDQPSLATECTHLPDVVDIHQSASMNSTEARVPQALVQDLKGLRGEVFLARSNDPNDLTVGLECVRCNSSIYAAT